MTAPSPSRRWWQVAAAGVVLLVTAVLTVIAISRSTITYALPGGSGSTTFGPGILASVVDVLCLAALAVLLVLAWQRFRPAAMFWTALVIPLVIALAITTVAITVQTPSF